MSSELNKWSKSVSHFTILLYDFVIHLMDASKWAICRKIMRLKWKKHDYVAKSRSNMIPAWAQNRQPIVYHWLYIGLIYVEKLK